MDWHQDWYLAHCRLAGQPAERKQSAICRIHSATAILQLGWSEKIGRGLEHHLPQPYSQVGVGAAMETHLVDEVVDLVDEGVVFVDVVNEAVDELVEMVDEVVGSPAEEDVSGLVIVDVERLEAVDNVVDIMDCEVVVGVSEVELSADTDEVKEKAGELVVCEVVPGASEIGVSVEEKSEIEDKKEEEEEDACGKVVSGVTVFSYVLGYDENS